MLVFLVLFMALAVSARIIALLLLADAHAGFIASLLLPLLNGRADCFRLVALFCGGCSLMLASFYHCCCR